MRPVLHINIFVKILRGSVGTQTMLDGLTIYPPVANFSQCICAKNYESWLAVNKIIATIIRLTVLCLPEFRSSSYLL